MHSKNGRWNDSAFMCSYLAAAYWTIVIIAIVIIVLCGMGRLPAIVSLPLFYKMKRHVYLVGKVSSEKLKRRMEMQAEGFHVEYLPNNSQVWVKTSCFIITVYD